MIKILVRWRFEDSNYVPGTQTIRTGLREKAPADSAHLEFTRQVPEREASYALIWAPKVDWWCRRE